VTYPDLPVLQRRRTKIVATIGPASREPAVIEELIRAGVNVFRLNFSHGTHAEHRTAYERIRGAALRLGEPIGIIADLSGPKIRTGRFAGGRIELVKGAEVTVTTREVMGAPGLIPSHYAGLPKDVGPGDRILLDDGLLELKVLRVEGTEVSCTVVDGGPLKDHKGMNLPGVRVSAPALTEKDWDDARFALELGVDFLALSFVREAHEVHALQRFVAEAGQATQVIAKIERPEALEAIDGILEAADAIMVARGDLGVELPPEAVPIAQRQLVAQARARSKPVIVATQMLESMISSPRPTRAEVSDVSHAAFSGADAVMLSGETAVGAYPVQAVQMMDRVARQVESWQWRYRRFVFTAEAPETPPPIALNSALARATAGLSRDLRVQTSVVLSRTGRTATVMAAARPAAPIVAVTADAATCRRMNLLWGVVPHKVQPEEFAHPTALARRLAREAGMAEEGQYLLMVAGIRTTEGESEPVITILRV
jgi:pyruvate kinase